LPYVGPYGNPFTGRTPSTSAAAEFRENRQAERFFSSAYFFLPWFLTASMAVAAASGSR
jgi:hypothetical protein